MTESTRKMRKTLLAALDLLSRTDCYTARAGNGNDTISGASARQLVDGGLAAYVSGWQIVQPDKPTKVAITSAGRAVLQEQKDCV